RAQALSARAPRRVLRGRSSPAVSGLRGAVYASHSASVSGRRACSALRASTGSQPAARARARPSRSVWRPNAANRGAPAAAARTRRPAAPGWRLRARVRPPARDQSPAGTGPGSGRRERPPAPAARAVRACARPRPGDRARARSRRSCWSNAGRRTGAVALPCPKCTAAASDWPGRLLLLGRLLGDDLVLDLVVGRLRDDLFGNQLLLLRVRPALDDLLGVGVADAGQLLELGLAGRIEVERLFLGRRRARFVTGWGCGWFGRGGRWRRLRRRGRGTFLH